MSKKNKIMFLSASPNDQLNLSLDEEFRAIYEKVDRDFFEIISASKTRASDIQSRIIEEKPEIIHFSGHGTADEILFENDARGSQGVPKNAIINFFDNLNKKPRLVFFNACETAENLERLNRIIDFVVVTLRPVFDDAAVIFATKFYEFLSLGEGVKTSFNHAQNEPEILSVQQTDEPIFSFAENESGVESPGGETKIYKLFIRDGVNAETVFVTRSDKKDKEKSDFEMKFKDNTFGKTVIVQGSAGDINMGD